MTACVYIVHIESSNDDNMAHICDGDVVTFKCISVGTAQVWTSSSGQVEKRFHGGTPTQFSIPANDPQIFIVRLSYDESSREYVTKVVVTTSNFTHNNIMETISCSNNNGERKSFSIVLLG